jgi:spermidine synthase
LKLPRNLPRELLEDGVLPGARGFVDGDWYFEEDCGATRRGLLVEQLLHEEQSPFQTIRVYETPFFGRVLTLDDIVMLTERDEFVYHEMLVHVPLCSLEAPRSVLIVGGGDCGCLREVLRHDGVERVVQCDIDERVTRICERWFPWAEPAVADSRTELVFSDAIAYVAEHPESFDIVIVDGTDPKGPAVGLFTTEFYASVARALRPGGVMTAQTESPHWDAGMVGAIYQQIRGAFTQVASYLCAIPSYPSGCWTLAYAANERTHGQYFATDRAAAIAESSLYYNAAVHHAAFALPGFAARAVAGENPFVRFEERVRSRHADPKR